MLAGLMSLLTEIHFKTSQRKKKYFFFVEICALPVNPAHLVDLVNGENRLGHVDTCRVLVHAVLVLVQEMREISTLSSDTLEEEQPKKEGGYDSIRAQTPSRGRGTPCPGRQRRA